MSDGMSEYWRERRKAEREKSIKFHFYDMITALLWNRISLKRDMEAPTGIEPVSPC